MQVIWSIFGQQPSLQQLEGLPTTPGVEAGPNPDDHRDGYRRVVAIEPPGAPQPNGPFRRLAEAIKRYDIFPPSLVRPLLRGPLNVGDTFGTRYHFLPGVDFFFGGRVIDVFDGADDAGWRAGFTFRTLIGHPEMGEETFAVAKNAASGEVEVSLRNWSRPALLLTRLAGPYTRWAQRSASYAALDHLEEIARRPGYKGAA
jgi:hypothetical protein